jgi:hypothetical protein
MCSRIVLTLAALLASVVTAGAQTFAPTPRAERPYRGLFGGGVGEAEQLLTLNASLGGGYDDNIFMESNVGGTPTDPRAAQSGSYALASGTLNYSFNKSRLAFGASAGVSTRRYSESSEDLVTAYGGSIGGSFRFTERQSLTFSQAVNYQPYLNMIQFPALFEPELGQDRLASLDAVTALTDYYSYNSTVGYTARLGRRDNFELGYSRRVDDFETENSDYTARGGHARYTHEVSRGLGLRVGYGYNEGRYPAAADARTLQWRTWDVGVDFARALSFSRRTELSFATGTSAVADNNQTYYRFTGEARLNREIGRTWNATASYRRGVEFVAAFSEPFLSDGFSVGFGGMLNRRLQFGSAVGGALGSVGVGAEQNYDTYYASATLTYGVTRYMGLGTEYFFYRYRFDETVGLPSGMSRHSNRQGVRVYLSLWAPLIHRARRPDAPR